MTLQSRAPPVANDRWKPLPFEWEEVFQKSVYSLGTLAKSPEKKCRPKTAFGCKLGLLACLDSQNEWRLYSAMALQSFKGQWFGLWYRLSKWMVACSCSINAIVIAAGEIGGHFSKFRKVFNCVAATWLIIRLSQIKFHEHFRRTITAEAIIQKSTLQKSWISSWWWC